MVFLDFHRVFVHLGCVRHVLALLHLSRSILIFPITGQGKDGIGALESLAKRVLGIQITLW